jgi:tetratricopeptide (TPR) repeat protein
LLNRQSGHSDWTCANPRRFDSADLSRWLSICFATAFQAGQPRFASSETDGARTRRRTDQEHRELRISARSLLAPKRGMRHAFRHRATVHFIRLLLIGGIITGTTSLTDMGLIATARGTQQDADAARLAAAIADKTAKLNLKPRTAKLIPEKAARVRDLIRQAKYVAAHKIITDVLDSSQLQSWRYYPFSDFAAGISDVRRTSFEEKLNDWVAQNTNDPIPLIIRAQYYYDVGWFKRGHNFAKDTPANQFADFQKYMKKGLADAEAAMQLNDGTPYSSYLRLLLLRGFGITEKMKRAFEESIGRYPDYYPLYDLMLSTLQPRWGGTPAAMYDFVDRYAGHATDDSPLKLLYLSLYRHLLSSASVACDQLRQDKGRLAQCIAAHMARYISPALEERVQTALRLYDHSDKHQFTIAIKDILFGMLQTAGGDVYSGAVLDLAAAAMHSDTRLKEDKPGPNNYIIDEAVAESWYQKKFYDNAITKYQEALRDLKLAAFPNEEERNLAASLIYDRLAGASDKLHQYIDIIVYESAAIAAGGKTGHEHFICYGYYQLKQYDEALRTCTDAVDKADNLLAHYWRGMAYRDSGDKEAALPDLRIIADSEHSFRASAAIEMSVIYDELKDFQGSLDVLNKYTYLYDAKTQNTNDVAASYNNRCYAYMELGELKKALDECTASLRYGSLPDAYRKQQELVKRLKTRQTDL